MYQRGVNPLDTGPGEPAVGGPDRLVDIGLAGKNVKTMAKTSSKNEGRLPGS